MKRLIIAMACLVALTITSCDGNHNRSYSSGGNVYVNNQPDVVVTPEATNLGDNLNLQALGELVKTSSNAQDIENKLNASGSINNLDLDGDGSVDYIKVTEYGTGDDRGFSFTVDMPNDEKQEIATVDLQKGSNGADMNIQGNQQIYGQSAYYQSHYSLSDVMIMSYLFSRHSMYLSPYHYGYYPSYYHSYRSVPMASYSSRVSNTTKTSKITKTTTTTSKVKSPNASLNSKKVNSRAASLSNPTRSQKSFTKTSASKSQPKTGGFGNKSSGSSSSYKSTPSYKSSSSSRSSSSRSGGFGSSSRSGRRR